MLWHFVVCSLNRFKKLVGAGSVYVELKSAPAKSDDTFTVLVGCRDVVALGNLFWKYETSNFTAFATNHDDWPHHCLLSSKSRFCWSASSGASFGILPLKTALIAAKRCSQVNGCVRSRFPLAFAPEWQPMHFC